MSFLPFQVIGENRPSRWLVICDHASNAVPPQVGGGTLGLPATDMARHIAFDVGAAGVALALGERLDAPVICSTFSRLVIDPNRGETDPTLLMRLYDGSVIPANRHADRDEIERRLGLCHRPYHTELARLAARQDDTVILSIHSYTPQLTGRPARPWQIGVLHADDARLSRPLLARLHTVANLTVGENEPYKGHLPGDTIDRHALSHDRHNTLIELRNDLIADATGQAAWADLLAPQLDAALNDAQL